LATIFRILTPKNFGLRAFLKEIPTRSIIVERQMDSALSPIVRESSLGAQEYVALMWELPFAPPSYEY
jgi:hypothetical protein